MALFVGEGLEPDSDTAELLARFRVFGVRGQFGETGIVDIAVVNILDQTEFLGYFLDLHEVVEVLGFADGLGEDALDIIVPDILGDVNRN